MISMVCVICYRVTVKMQQFTLGNKKVDPKVLDSRTPDNMFFDSIYGNTVTVFVTLWEISQKVLP